MKKKSLKTLQQQVEKFNLRFKCGDKVKLRQDAYSDWEEVTVRSPATILGGHSAVGWFKEKSGCHSLDFVKY